MKIEIYHIYSDQSHTRFIVSKYGVRDKKFCLEHWTFFHPGVCEHLGMRLVENTGIESKNGSGRPLYHSNFYVKLQGNWMSITAMIII